MKARIGHDLVTYLDYSFDMRTARRAFTLIELLVVLAIMAIATALVAPAILRPFRDDAAQLSAVVTSAREIAAARGEIIYLQFDPSGEWHTEGGGAQVDATITRGRIRPLSTAPLTLIIAPTGSCSFNVRSIAVAATAVTLDPLTCELARH
ncbi:MAG TPA: type II secretion system protein [Gemmatimonadaceae bacterium]|nr:type II secretion system protein [Gemmatimonadaceae bacterium]